MWGGAFFTPERDRRGGSSPPRLAVRQAQAQTRTARRKTRLTLKAALPALLVVAADFTYQSSKQMYAGAFEQSIDGLSLLLLFVIGPLAQVCVHFSQRQRVALLAWSAVVVATVTAANGLATPAGSGAWADQSGGLIAVAVVLLVLRTGAVGFVFSCGVRLLAALRVAGQIEDAIELVRLRDSAFLTADFPRRAPEAGKADTLFARLVASWRRKPAPRSAVRAFTDSSDTASSWRGPPGRNRASSNALNSNFSTPTPGTFAKAKIQTCDFTTREGADDFGRPAPPWYRCADTAAATPV